jgi:hypothetical protein
MKRWLPVLLLAACSTAQWDKPGATQGVVDADLRSCSTVAQSFATLPQPRTTSTGIEIQPHPTDRDADRQLQLSQRVQACMREKGYALKSG